MRDAERDIKRCLRQTHTQQAEVDKIRAQVSKALSLIPCVPTDLNESEQELFAEVLEDADSLKARL